MQLVAGFSRPGRAVSSVPLGRSPNRPQSFMPATSNGGRSILAQEFSVGKEIVLWKLELWCLKF